MKVLIFSPSMSLWNYTYAMASVAERLASQQNEITIVGCHGVYAKYCDVMRSTQIPIDAADKKAACKRCIQVKKFVGSQFQARILDLDSFVSREDLELSQSLVESLVPDQSMEFNLEGIPFGKIAMYLIVTTYKKSNARMSAEEWVDFKLSLENVIITFLGMKKLLEQYRPDHCLVYNSLYPVHNTVRYLLKQLSIPTFVIHGSMSLPRMDEDIFISPEDPFYYAAYTKKVWREFQDQVCLPEQLKEVTEHLLYLFESKSGRVYSTRSIGSVEEICKRYGIAPGQKVFLATMSSLDELWASQLIGSITDKEPVFADPIVWIRELIGYFSSRPEWKLVIRPHPREFPNQNVSIKSEHACALESQLLCELPDNIRVNWPSDRVSLYDLMEVTTVCLNAWSSVGEELGCLGIPVISYCPEFLNWPGELDYVGASREEYFGHFKKAAETGWSFERIRRFFRWKVLLFCRTTMRIKDVMPAIVPSFHRRLSDRLKRVIDPIHLEKREWAKRPTKESAFPDLERMLRERLPTLAHLELQETTTETSLEAETRALKVELRRIYECLYGNRIPTNPFLLQARLWESIQ